MQKVKSSTLKKLEKNKTITTVADYGLNRVSDWTKKELNELQKQSKLPICVELQSGDFLVATYKVEKISAVCWAADNLEFGDKRSAIFYCALMHINKVAEALELCSIDQQVSNFESNKSLFRLRLDAAHAVDDSFKVDLYSSRYDDARRRLNRAKLDLEKIISYNKTRFKNLANEIR